MKLEKAKEILELNIKEAGKQMPPDVKTALQLGVEALKREQCKRTTRSFHPDDLLPGETDGNGRR